MGKTNIQWTDYSWNPARGCTKVNDDCRFCYMMREGEKFGYDGKKVIKTKSVFNLPLRINQTKSKVWNGKPLVFTSSLTDFFHKDIDSFRNEAWNIIRKCPHLIFQILTKRPERINACLPDDWNDGWDNVWLGISAGNQENYDKMFSAFQNIKAKRKFLSLEPLHNPVNLCGTNYEWLNWQSYLNWVIIGGESGNETGNYRYRPCKIKWIEKIVASCINNGVPVFVKQFGTCLAKEMKMTDRHGGNINEFPEYLKIRQFPKIC